MANLRRAIALAVLATFMAAGVTLAGSPAKATHFTAAYFNGPGGFFTCRGTHIVRTRPTPSTTDHEICKISDVATWPAGRYPIVPVGSLDPDTANWFSDFNGAYASSGSVVVFNNHDGTGTMLIDAIY